VDERYRCVAARALHDRRVWPADRGARHRARGVWIARPPIRDPSSSERGEFEPARSPGPATASTGWAAHPAGAATSSSGDPRRARSLRPASRRSSDPGLQDGNGQASNGLSRVYARGVRAARRARPGKVSWGQIDKCSRRRRQAVPMPNFVARRRPTAASAWRPRSARSASRSRATEVGGGFKGDAAIVSPG
jgi:hypothetical protein